MCTNSKSVLGGIYPFLKRTRSNGFIKKALDFSRAFFQFVDLLFYCYSYFNALTGSEFAAKYACELTVIIAIIKANKVANMYGNIGMSI